MILTFYFFREKKALMDITYVTVSLFGLIGVIVPNFVGKLGYLMDVLLVLPNTSNCNSIIIKYNRELIL